MTPEAYIIAGGLVLIALVWLFCQIADAGNRARHAIDSICEESEERNA